MRSSALNRSMNSLWAARGGQGSQGAKTARRKRIMEERDFRDAQGLAHLDPAPARDMESFGRGGEAIRALVDRASPGRPFRESIACVDRALQSRIKGAERFAELSFERRDAVPAEHEFGSVVQEFTQGLAWISAPSASRIVSTG